MKMKSYFNFTIAFSEISLRLSVKNTHTSYSLPLHPTAFVFVFVLCQDCHKSMLTFEILARKTSLNEIK